MDGYINKSNLMWLERLILSLLIGAVYYYPNSLISEIPVVSSQDINFLKLGRAIFEQSCAVGYCHGKAGRAGRGPRLRGKEWESNYLIKVIENGFVKILVKLLKNIFQDRTNSRDFESESI